MSRKTVRIADVLVGDPASLLLVAGPCVIEDEKMCLDIARKARDAARDAGMGFVFKGSFDKANRSSVRSFRGVGLRKGLDILARVKDELNVPVLSDIHVPEQAAEAAKVLDCLQIPAFLCRQTDLLQAAAETGKPVNVKKGQFVSPSEMQNVLDKLSSAGNENVLLTERGTMFGYNDLVVDMRGLVVMGRLGAPVLFDGTHSVMSPARLGDRSGGDRSMVAPLCRAAAAVGVDGFFIETHPDPDNALSDAATQLPLDQLNGLLKQIAQIHQASR